MGIVNPISVTTMLTISLAVAVIIVQSTEALQASTQYNYTVKHNYHPLVVVKAHKDFKKKAVKPIVVMPVEVPQRKAYEDDNKPIPVVDVDAVIGHNAELPCDINPKIPDDDVYLVLWYRHEAGKPLYSYDARDSSGQGKHWSAKEPFGTRAFFKVGKDMAYLLINDVQLEDEDIYRCRVDYRNSPTRNVKLNLTVVVPPNSPRILSEDARIDTSKAIAGIYNEGDAMRLKCDVVGGRPLPSVTWWINGSLVDDSYHTDETGTVVNRLDNVYATRDYDGSKIECRASNNKVTDPQARILEIKINLRPQSVTIIQKPSFVRAGEKYEFVCQAIGSKPVAELIWIKDRILFKTKHIKESYQSNPSVTTSILTFIPEKFDNGVRITCRAENPQIMGSAVDDSLLISVLYPPSLTLKLGRSLELAYIKENDDVYFECSVTSNPMYNSLLWLHNDVPIEQNQTRGILISNMSLVIQRVSRTDAGKYACTAENSQGIGKSNELDLNIKYRPVCATPEYESEYGVPVGGNVTVTCTVAADPPVTRFRWWFNSGESLMESAADDFTSSGSSSSMTYSVRKPDQYGTLSCVGINEIGSQQTPCRFEIKPQSHPRPLTDCTVQNRTIDTFEVSCNTNGNGGNVQFILELYNQRTRFILRNLTNPMTPVWTLQNMRQNDPVVIEVYAVNRLGASQKTIISDIELRKPEKFQTVTTTNESMRKDWMFFFSCILGLVMILIIAFLIFLFHRRRSLSKKLSNCRTNLAAASEDMSSPENSSQDYTSTQDDKKKAKVVIPSQRTSASSAIVSSAGLEPTDSSLKTKVVTGTAMAQTKPILKPTNAEPWSQAPPYQRSNWYPNPLHPDQQQVWMSHEHDGMLHTQQHLMPHSIQKPTYPGNSTTLNRRAQMKDPSSDYYGRNQERNTQPYHSLPRKSIIEKEAARRKQQMNYYNHNLTGAESDKDYLLKRESNDRTIKV